MAREKANKLASLEATLVQNTANSAGQPATSVECRVTRRGAEREGEAGEEEEEEREIVGGRLKTRKL